MTTPYLAGWSLGDVLLCCPGPSLAEIPSELRRPGLVIAAINTAYPKVNPDIWFGMDIPECYNTSLIKESFIKIFRDCYSAVDFNGGSLHDHFNTYFTTVEEHPSGIAGMIDFDFPFVPWYKNTLATALYLLMWMGAKNIYLTGCDMGGDRDYWDDRVLGDKERDKNQKLYGQQLDFLAKLKPLAESIGVKIISATANSPINTFLESVNINELLESFPGPGNENVPHVLEVRASKIAQSVKGITWTQPSAERGVLIMCDSGQEWMLEWWWMNYRKYNTLPVHFVDIGMTDYGKQWCQSHGTFASLPEIDLKHWYKKPYAFTTTPFLETIYMDNDCQVMGDLTPIFKYADPVGISMDIVTRWTAGKVPVQAGVIAFQYGADLLRNWAINTPDNSNFFRGDQEILQAMLSNSEEEFMEMPERYNWVRGRGINPNALINHWTGDDGKEIIRQQIKQLQHDLAAN
jgi:hypothetical protein